MTREEVEQAIQARRCASSRTHRGTTARGPTSTSERHRPAPPAWSTLALLTAGEPVNSPTIAEGARLSSGSSPPSSSRAPTPSRSRRWSSPRRRPSATSSRSPPTSTGSSDAQIKPGDRVNWPGSWTYTEFKTGHGDNSNTQYALLGLNAASEVGVPVKPEVWALARQLLGAVPAQRRRAGATPPTPAPRHRQHDLRGDLQPDHHRPEAVPGAGVPGRRPDPELRQGGRQPQPPARHRLDGAATSGSARTSATASSGGIYYLYGLERAGRLTGQRFFGEHDWYREGAEELVHDQDQLYGFWQRRRVRAETRSSPPASPSSSWPRGGRRC